MASQESANSRVIIVGAGLAGSVAGARAAQLGRDVLVLDSAPDPSAGGNTAMSGGGVHLTAQRLDSPFLRDRVLAQGWGHARLPLVDALVSVLPEAHRWLIGCGVRFQSKDAGERDEPIPADTVLAPKRDMYDVHAWRNRGPQQALRALQAVIRSNGGEIRESASARELSQDRDGRVNGVILEDGHKFSAGAVLLSDGGFQANLQLRKRFIGPRADRMFMRGAASGQGAGLLMAQAVGAHVANAQWIYGHVLHRDVLGNDRLWPWPALDTLIATGGIVVDDRGRRFTDEGRGGIHVANAIAWSDDPAGAWVVLNEDLWNRAAHSIKPYSTDPVPANPTFQERGARIVRGDSPASLAAQAGFDSGEIGETLRTYNVAAVAGRTGKLPILRSRGAIPLEGNLLAFPAVAGITFTMGGVAIDEGARVIDEEGATIPGLYAAGGTAAGPTAGYIGGLATALGFGHIAGGTMSAA